MPGGDLERGNGMFQLVSETNLETAAWIHAESWRESHRGFCSPAFVQAHTTEAQSRYIRGEMRLGKRFYLLTLDSPKGIVSVWGRLIENLYVLPCEQRKGYGTMLLRHAEGQCEGPPTLWALSNNHVACSWYQRMGYVLTGRQKALNPSLAELEMVRRPKSLMR